MQVKWAKLRGTPGSAPEKLVEAEREVNEAETRLRDTKIAYEVSIGNVAQHWPRPDEGTDERTAFVHPACWVCSSFFVLEGEDASRKDAVQHAMTCCDVLCCHAGAGVCHDRGAQQVWYLLHV